VVGVLNVQVVVFDIVLVCCCCGGGENYFLPLLC
jgi:hypothetical protein